MNEEMLSPIAGIRDAFLTKCVTHMLLVVLNLYLCNGICLKLTGISKLLVECC